MNYTNEELSKLVKDMHSRDAGLLGAPIVGTLIKLIEDAQESERMCQQAEEVASQWRKAFYKARKWADAWKAASHKYREGYRQAEHILEELDWRPDS